VRMTLLLAALLAVPALARAEDTPATPDLTTIGLEDLMQLEVTSVSRHEEPLFRAASAITVITADDITRSGAASIPDLLRGVPGMDVAQINRNTWAVSARGFTGQYANKMLVLVDGRTVYNPLFSGVYWNVLDLLLEDVQRIEVIRGPGATAWGTNAVNGVINIITKTASAAPGLVATPGAGVGSSGSGGLRYAGPAGRSADLRVFAKYQHDGRLDDLAGRTGHDALGLAHFGGRFDWRRSARDLVNVQGDFYDGTVEERYSTPSLDPPYATMVDSAGPVRGGNLMASWQRTLSATSDFRLKGYFDESEYQNPLNFEDVRTLDVDFQHRLPIGNRQDFMWGGGARIVDIATQGSLNVWFSPLHRTDRLANLFFQDAITVLPRRVTLTLGSKFERSDLSAFEIEPSARVLWAVSPSQTVWSAVSRAVRTPGPADEHVNANLTVFPLGGGAVGETRLIGTDMQSEVMTSIELGYRAHIGPRVSIDLAGYQSRYVHLRAIEPGTPFPESNPAPAHMVFPVYFTNGFHGTTRGLEGTLEWRPVSRFGVTVSHSLFWMELKPDAEFLGTASDAVGDAPTYKLSVHPHLVVARHFNLDATWDHVDDLPKQLVPAYDRVDARLGWSRSRKLELAAGVQNLFHDRELEFGSTSGTNLPTTVRTGVYGQVTWRP